MLLPAIQSWKEWGTMFTDVSQWTAAVDEVCLREGIRFSQIQAGYPGTNAVFVLDRRHVVKIYAPFCHRDFDLERTLYPLLSRHTTIPSPQLLAQGVLDDAIRWPYIVMDFKTGQPIREVRAQISRDTLVAIAADLGEMIRAIHDISLAQLDGLGSLVGERETFVEARKTRCIQDLREESRLPAMVIDEIPAFLTAQTETIDRPLRLVNGDLTEDHILLEQRHGCWQISGLIDFADATIAPQEYEWIALWFGALACHGDEFRACIRHYASTDRTILGDIARPATCFDASFYDTMMAFTLLHEFGAGIIDTTLKRWAYPEIQSLQDLQDVLWRSRLTQ